MKKENCFRYVENNMSTYPVDVNINGEGYTVGAHRQPKVTYHFEADALPDIIRLKGNRGFVIDVSVAEIQEKILNQTEDDVFTLGRAPECDKQVAKFDENRVSRMQVILQHKGNEVILVNLGHYGTTALKKTQFGLEELAPCEPELWRDYEAWLGSTAIKPTPRKKPWWHRMFS